MFYGMDYQLKEYQSAADIRETVRLVYINNKYYQIHQLKDINSIIIPSKTEPHRLVPDDTVHLIHRPARGPVEGGGGADRHPSTCKPPVERRLTQVQGRKMYRDSYNGDEALSRSIQNIPRPPIPGLPGPKEGL